MRFGNMHLNIAKYFLCGKYGFKKKFIVKGPLISRDHELFEQQQLLRLLLAKPNRRQKTFIWKDTSDKYTAAAAAEGWWTGKRTAWTSPAGCPPSCWSCVKWKCFSSPGQVIVLFPLDLPREIFFRPLEKLTLSLHWRAYFVIVFEVNK